MITETVAWKIENEMLAAKCAELTRQRDALWLVCKSLDAHQKRYGTNACNPEGMPGNDFYSGLAMAIVRQAREAIAMVEGGTDGKNMSTTVD